MYDVRGKREEGDEILEKSGGGKWEKDEVRFSVRGKGGGTEKVRRCKQALLMLCFVGIRLAFDTFRRGKNFQNFQIF